MTKLTEENLGDVGVLFAVVKKLHWSCLGLFELRLILNCDMRNCAFTGMSAHGHRISQKHSACAIFGGRVVPGLEALFHHGGRPGSTTFVDGNEFFTGSANHGDMNKSREKSS